MNVGRLSHKAQGWSNEEMRGQRQPSARPSYLEIGEVSSLQSLRGANSPRYNYSAARHIYARGNQIA